MKKLSNIQKIIILLSIPTLFFGGYQYFLEFSLYWSINKWMYWLCWLFMLVVAFFLFKKKPD